MKKILTFSILIFINTSVLMFGNNLKPENNRTYNTCRYQLVWEDNFDTGSLDETNNWFVVVNGKGGGNRELQYYKRDNISVGKEPVSGNRCLIITARKENHMFKKATSGRISTQNKMSFRYGKVEARIKLPKTENGLWPAFWMLGNNYPKTVWPKCGEIDILEMGSAKGIETFNQERYFNGACHWGEKFNRGSYPNYTNAVINQYPLQDDFHLYTLIWNKNSIKMYLDMDKYPDTTPYFEMAINGENIPGEPARYFHHDFFLIFNLAVGGNFTGIRNMKGITALKHNEAKMYIDYVRLYQEKTDEEVFNWNQVALEK